jgi:hypothetical protein
VTAGLALRQPSGTAADRSAAMIVLLVLVIPTDEQIVVAEGTAGLMGR